MSAWRPIDTAPKDGTPLLLWIGEPKIGWYVTGPEFKGCPPSNCWIAGYLSVAGSDAGFDRLGKPTHWQPLPKRPIKKK